MDCPCNVRQVWRFEYLKQTHNSLFARLPLRSHSLCDSSMHTPLDGHAVRQSSFCRQLLRVGQLLLGFNAGSAFLFGFIHKPFNFSMQAFILVLYVAELKGCFAVGFIPVVAWHFFKYISQPQRIWLLCLCACHGMAFPISAATRGRWFMRCSNCSPVRSLAPEPFGLPLIKMLLSTLRPLRWRGV